MSIRAIQNRLFLLNTAHTTYALGIDDQGVLRQLHFGPVMARGEDLLEPLLHPDERPENGGDGVPEEYSSFGCLRNKETALKVAYADRTSLINSIKAQNKAEDDKEAFSDAPISEGGDAGVVVSDAPVQADIRPERYIHNNRRYNTGAGGGEKR